MRTPVLKKEQLDQPDELDAQREWYIIDAADKPVGRVATQVAMVLRGKNKPTFTPHVDMGDFVIIVNAAKAALTGNKLEQKRYYRHSQWPGGLKERTAKQMLEEKPTYIMEHAVKGMLPKGRLGRKLLKKLKVYAGAEHPHKAQKPQAFPV